MDKQYYIKLNGELIPVSEEIYRAYHQPEWREKKRTKARSMKEFSYDLMSDTELINISEISQKSVDETVNDMFLNEQLHIALKALTTEEQLLITELFFNNKSERELASKTGYSKTSINKQKNKIILKLKKSLENW